MKKIQVLFYNRMWKNIPFTPEDMPEDFELTENKELLPVVDVVVFHLPTLYIENDIEKKDGQIWVACSMECEQHSPQFGQPEVAELFDLRMGYHPGDDICLSYFKAYFEEAFRTPLSPKTNDRLICMFISSAFNKSNRLQYTQELAKYIPIHSYSRVMRNQALPEDHGKDTKLEIIKNYRFTIAFENAIAEDYVTEKFYQPLLTGSLPVYLGAPNVADFSPGENAFIDVRNYPSPQKLADYLLYLSQHESEYRNYMAWREKPYSAHCFLKICGRNGEIMISMMWQLVIRFNWRIFQKIIKNLRRYW